MMLCLKQDLLPKKEDLHEVEEGEVPTALTLWLDTRGLAMLEGGREGG